MGVGGPALSKPQRLSQADGITYARQLLAAGQPAAAREIIAALRQLHPKDANLLVLLSQAERALKHTKTAVDAGAAAWVFAQTPAEKFASAVVAAQAHVDAEHFGRAEFWMRRAVQAAPSPQAKAVVGRDLTTLKQLNPLTVDINLGMAPSSNVNNGSSRETTTFKNIIASDGKPLIFYLAPRALALSGFEVTGQVALKYRLRQSATSQTYANLGVFVRSVELSSKSKAAAPAARNLDYASQQISGGLTHLWSNAQKTKVNAVTFALTQSYSGGVANAQLAMLRFTRDWTLGNGDHLGAGFGVERIRFSPENQISYGRKLSGYWQHSFKNQDSLGFGFELSQVNSAAKAREYSGILTSGSYDFGSIGHKLSLTLGYQAELRHYSGLFPLSGAKVGARDDFRQSLTIDIGLQAFEFYGFTPFVNTEVSRTHSNADLYNSQNAQIGLSLKSSF